MKANAKRRFGVADRGEILKLFDNKCVLCGSTKNLAIHHIDNNGRRKKTPNNDPKNLSVICHLCHYKTHVHKSITEEDIVRAMRQRIEVGRNDQPSKE
jgi:predicted restriction endonuclease